MRINQQDRKITGPLGLGRFASLALVVIASIVVILLPACSRTTGEPSEADQQAIKQLLSGYLENLAEAYRSGDVEVLRDYAVEKEVATVYKSISDLMTEEGRIIDSTLKSFEIEKTTVWNYSNAFVTTMEIWDVRTLVSGSEIVLGESVDQRSRVKYQLKRTDDGWRVIYRQREQQPE